MDPIKDLLIALTDSIPVSNNPSAALTSTAQTEPEAPLPEVQTPPVNPQSVDEAQSLDEPKSPEKQAVTDASTSMQVAALETTESESTSDEAPSDPACNDSTVTEDERSERDEPMQIVTSRQSCTLCFEDDDDKMICCNKCKVTQHLECILLTPEMVSLIKTFYCRKCNEDFKLHTEWKLKRATKSKEREKKNLYFDVMKILDHRGDGEKREFLIHWKGYSPSESTWEPEIHLDNCYNMLQNYCTAQKIPFSKIEGIVGASSKMDGLNDANWIKPSEVLDHIKRMIKIYKIQTSLTLILWDDETPKLRDNHLDSLYLVPFEGHCYVVLYYAQKGIGYVADGTNEFSKHKDLAEKLIKLLEIPLIPRLYHQQVGVDHCGSSAAAISLELMNHHRLNLKPDNIIVSNRLRSRFTKLFHAEKSTTVPDKCPRDFRKKLTCDVCKKAFRFGQTRAFKRHLATHKS